jgi:hypothetical protein
MTETELVTYLLANSHRIPNRVFIACLALARMKLRPNHPTHIGDLMDVLKVNSASHVSFLFSRLRKCGLIEYTRGIRGNPGYIILRVGPAEGVGRRKVAHEAHPHTR